MMEQRVPLGRFCSEEEVAGTVAYLVGKDGEGTSRVRRSVSMAV